MTGKTPIVYPIHPDKLSTPSILDRAQSTGR
jgi:hypothetical protein